LKEQQYLIGVKKVINKYNTNSARIIESN
jgi:hypothetical protein